MAVESSPNAYDEAPYPGLSYGQSHPDRLATLATLMGLRPAPIGRCRVLELGCAGGGNLIPMAYALPESEFVGLDYSARQIEEGLAAVSALGLANIRLEQRNILDADDSLGQFDYIIAHGVYSWVPPAVRDRLLALGRRHLTSNGVAYVSYNTYPGWHMMGMVRQMMLYHTRHETDPHRRAVRARELLDFLVESAPASNSAYGAFLEAYRSGLVSKVANAESLLLHDELEETNDPVYFHEFLAHAAQHGLQYLVEAEFPSVVPTNLAPPVQEKLGQMAGRLLEMEQYMDFVRSRTFRQTLLVHREVEVQRALRVDLSQMATFHVATMAAPQSAAPDIAGPGRESFGEQRGAAFTTDHPLTKAAFIHLAEQSPHAAPFGDLVRAAGARLAAAGGRPRDEDAPLLASNLLQAFSYSFNLIELHLHVPPYQRAIGARPVSSPVARYQAGRGSIVTNLRHERSDLDEFTRFILLQLDGTRGRDTMLEEMVSLAANGLIKSLEASESLADAAAARARLGQELDRCLGWLAKAALLVA